ncbi:MAG: acyl-ACP--UDP-N-acetylglucosamine O-acyltransferase [Alphaproteobacteria bacterium]
MSKIHPTAVIEDGALIGDNVSIGAFCHIGADVEIAADVRLDTHVVITGNTKIGQGCTVFPFAVLGKQPQDLKYDGTTTYLTIGAGSIIREHVTVHRGTPEGGGITRIGENCFLMVDSHVAHDCQIGNHVVLINQATLAGHCEVGDHTILGGLSALHQFVRVGSYVFVAGMVGIENDVIPFGLAKGRRRAYLTGLNLIGLKRRGVAKQSIYALRDVYRNLFDGETRLIQERATAMASKHQGDSLVEELLAFVRERPERNLCLPKPRGQKSDIAEEIEGV